jgi:hypothetical protein
LHAAGRQAARQAIAYCGKAVVNSLLTTRQDAESLNLAVWSTRHEAGRPRAERVVGTRMEKPHQVTHPIAREIVWSHLTVSVGRNPVGTQISGQVLPNGNL